MKKKFPGHFKLSEAEIKKVWDECIFVLDANILLNLYRYSDDTRTQFLKILRLIKERIWVPNQAAKEYLRNRLGVIGQQEKAYDQTIEAIRKIEGDFKSKRQHPFLSEKSLKGLCGSFDQVVNELEKSQKSHTKLIANDQILNSIEKLVSERVGDPFEAETLEAIRKEGEKRYSSHIPPGYKDSSKGDDGDPYRKFGDLIIWKEIIEKAKSEKRDIILISDDNKDDWWLKFQGKTISPRPELIEEFMRETDQKFQMYLADRFLSYAAGYLKEQVSKPAIEELKKLREIEEVHRKKKRSLMRRWELKNRAQMLQEEMAELDANLSMMKEQRRCIESDVKHLYEYGANDDYKRSKEHSMMLEEKEMQLRDRMHRIMNELAKLESMDQIEPTSR